MADGGQAEREQVRLELDRALVPVKADRSMDDPTVCGSSHRADRARHDRGEHGRQGFGHDQPGGAVRSP